MFGLFFWHILARDSQGPKLICCSFRSLDRFQNRPAIWAVFLAYQWFVLFEEFQLKNLPSRQPGRPTHRSNLLDSPISYSINVCAFQTLWFIFFGHRSFKNVIFQTHHRFEVKIFHSSQKAIRSTDGNGSSFRRTNALSNRFNSFFKLKIISSLLAIWTSEFYYWTIAA